MWWKKQIVIMQENRKWRRGNDGKLKGNFVEILLKWETNKLIE
jgi:hypothetical protein